VVLGILVVLVGLLMPRVLGSQKKADLKAAQLRIGLFHSPLEQYAVDCKDFPSTEQGLQALITAPADLSAGARWDGPYLTGDVPKDPWGNEYQYEYPPTRGNSDFPDIWSFGPSLEDDGDDVCNWNKGSGSSDGTDVAMMDERGPGRGGEARKAPRRESSRVGSGRTGGKSVGPTTSKIGGGPAEGAPVKGGRGAAPSRTPPPPRIQEP